MLGIFRKKPLRTSFFPRGERKEIDSVVYIKRVGKPTLRANHGNISSGGLYVQIPDHDLERGKKVEVILVSKHGSLRQLSRMKGIIIRIDSTGAAMVTYKKQILSASDDFNQEQVLLQQEFDDI